MWKQVVRIDKKKRMRKKKGKNPEKNKKKRCIDENIGFCYQEIVRKKRFLEISLT